MAIKEYVRKMGAIIEFVIMIPFMPIAIGLALYFGWVLSVHSKIPEDLEEQVQCANRQDLDTKW